MSMDVISLYSSHKICFIAHLSAIRSLTGHVVEYLHGYGGVNKETSNTYTPSNVSLEDQKYFPFSKLY